MRILFLNSAKEWGGNEKWTVEAATGLAQRGHTVYLGCRSPIFKNKIITTKIQVVAFAFANVIDLFTIIKLILFMKRNRVDLLIPTKQREYLLGGIAARVVSGVKVAARLGIDRQISNLRNKIAFCNLFDAVIVNSKRIIDTLSLTPKFDIEKCKLIYNGVAVPVISEEKRECFRKKIGLDERIQLIAVVGRLSAQKGIDMALKAFALLQEYMNNPVHLVIVGEGVSYDEYLQLAHALKIEKNVTFTGYADDVSGYLQASDLYWLTSRSEGMANSLLEAMAHKKVVIAFDIAGVCEVIEDGENGFIIPCGDIKMLATRSAFVLSYSNNSIIGLKAFETVTKKFTTEVMVSTLEKCLLDLKA